MKWLFVFALLAVGMASAELVLEDESGDVEATITNWNGPVDLLALEIAEEETSLDFRLDISDANASPDVVFVTTVNYNVFMNYGENEWDLRLYRNVNIDGNVFWGGTLRQLNTDDFSFGSSIFVELEGNTIIAKVPRGALSNEDDQQLSRGRTLDSIRVESSARQINILDQRPLEARDSMPNDQVGANWEAKLGPRQEGPATFWSEKPYRSSNGEKTTYAFEVKINSPEARELQLRVDNVPAGWNIILPVASVNSADNVTIPVLAQVPMRHDHGLTETFSLIGENGEDYTELQMGVHYLDPAEISGHHNTAYLRTVPGGEFNFNDLVTLDFSYGLMVTDEDYEYAIDKPVTSNSGSTVCETGSTMTCERFYYHAPLYNGFDANIDEQGIFHFLVDFPTPVLDAHAVATLRHQSYDGEYTEEIIFQGESASVGQSNGATEFEVTLDTLPYADRILVARSQSLELQIELWYQGAPNMVGIGDNAPLKVGISGGELTLPLNDYHDDVSAYFDGIPSLQVKVPADAQTVNDGETRLFAVELQNIGSTELELHLVLDGEWAQLLGPDALTLAPSTSEIVNVAMRPVGATNGQQGDAVLTIHGEGQQEIVTLRAIVTDQDVPDDAELASELQTEETPWPVALILPALAAAWPRRQER